MTIETLPEDAIDVFLTDGNEVENPYRPRFNRYGQCIIDKRGENLATHWKPYPKPPMKVLNDKRKV